MNIRIVPVLPAVNVNEYLLSPIPFKRQVFADFLEQDWHYWEWYDEAGPIREEWMKEFRARAEEAFNVAQSSN